MSLCYDAHIIPHQFFWHRNLFDARIIELLSNQLLLILIVFLIMRIQFIFDLNPNILFNVAYKYMNMCTHSETDIARS